MDALFGLALFGAAFAFFFEYFLTLDGRPTDWRVHLIWSEAISFRTPPNRLFHLIVNVVGQAAFTLAVLASVFKAGIGATVALVYCDRNRPAWLRWSLGAVVTFAMPVMLFSDSMRPYLGQFSPNPIHSPTYILMAPLALLTWWVFTRRVLDSKIPDWRWLAILGIIGALTVFAKPSFHVGFFVPAVLLCLWSLARNPEDRVGRFWWLIMSGLVLFVPLLFITGFVTGTVGSGEVTFGFEINPFAVMKMYFVDMDGAFLAAFLIPAIIMALLWRSSLTDYMIAGLVFLVSCILIMVLFAEVGERISHANFLWTAYIGVLVFYSELAAILCRFRSSGLWQSAKWWMAIGLFALHGGYGVKYLWHIYQGGHYV